MSSKTDYEKAVDEVLIKMYKEATPPLDFKKVRDNPEDFSDTWFDNHYLSSDRQKEILGEVKQKYNFNNKQEASLTIKCITDLGPTSNPDDVEETD